MKPTFFKTPDAFRQWLSKNHLSQTELLVGFYKVGSGKPSMSWPQSVDQALCFGWIDGVRKGVDDVSYTIRFTPRKKGSIWSNVNIYRAKELIETGLMQPAGLQAYEVRCENKSGIYSHEQGGVELVEPYQSLLKKKKAAWDFFHAQPASYRKAACWWIISAKQEPTRIRRLELLITCSLQSERIPQFTSKRKG